MDDLEEGWTAHKAPTGHTYYYNAATKKSTYKKPLKVTQKTIESDEKLRTDESEMQTAKNNVLASDSAAAAAISMTEPKFDAPTEERSFAAGPEPVRRRGRHEDRPKQKQSIPGAEPWLEVVTKFGHTFYHNPSTAESVWSAPAEIQQSLDEWNQYRHEDLAREEAPDSQVNRLDYDNSQTYSDAAEDQEHGYDEVLEQADEETENMEFNEDDIARQLEAMQEAGESAVETDFGAYPDFTQEEKEKIFLQMLSDNNVDVYQTWDSQVEKIASDPRYLILDTTHSRKAVFQEYCVRKIKQHQDEKASRTQEDPKVVFLRFIKEHARDGQYFVDFKRKHRKAEPYKHFGNSDHEREKLFRTFQDCNKLSSEQKEAEFVALLRTATAMIEHDVRYYIIDASRAADLLIKYRTNRQ